MNPCIPTEAGGECIAWFDDLGFRPVIWTPPHRADGVDPDRMIVAPDADEPMLSKYDPYGHLPESGYGWGTWIPQPDAPQIAAASLAGPAAATSGTSTGITPTLPWWPIDTGGPSYPCRCITVPPEVPPVAPVPLPASAGLLIAAVAGLMIVRGRA